MVSGDGREAVEVRQVLSGGILWKGLSNKTLEMRTQKELLQN